MLKKTNTSATWPPPSLSLTPDPPPYGHVLITESSLAPLKKRVLVSYDVAKEENSTRAKVYRMVFGYEVKNGDRRPYRYEGYLDRPGSRHIGQSVVLLRPEIARAFARRLERLGVAFWSDIVYIE